MSCPNEMEPQRAAINVGTRFVLMCKFELAGSGQIYRYMQSSFGGNSGLVCRLRAMVGGVLQARHIASRWPVLGKLLLPTLPSARYQIRGFCISADRQCMVRQGFEHLCKSVGKPAQRTCNLVKVLNLLYPSSWASCALVSP